MQERLLGALVCALLFAGLLGGATPARADSIVYDRPYDASLLGYWSRRGAQQTAEPFILAADARLTSITFWGTPYYGGGADRAFDVLFFSDSGGLPSTSDFHTVTTPTITAIDTGNVATDPLGVYSIYEYTATIDPGLLAAGTTYWVTIRAIEASDNWAWMNARTVGDAVVIGRTSDHDPIWRVYPAGIYDAQSVRFRGDVAVPEPTTLALFGLGVLGLAARFRRRREAA